MYSSRSENSHRRHYSDRSSRHWDDYGDRWEERHEPHRDVQRDSHHKYDGDGHQSTKRTSRSREYSNSPKRPFSQDSLSRDRSRKSPVRRRPSSPDWALCEKKRRRFTEDDEDEYRCRREPEDKTRWHSLDSFSRAHVTKDFKHTLQKEEDVRYKKTTQESRHRYLHEELTYKHQRDDATSRRSSDYYKERDGHERSRNRSQETTRSQDCFTKSFAKPREKNDSPFTDQEDRRQCRTRFPLNGSDGQPFESDDTGPKSTTKGFQRFLDVLNKGVNVDMLTKIVTQTSAEVNNLPCSPTSFMNAADGPWSPSCVEGQQGSHHDTSHCNETEGSRRLASPKPSHRSLSPKGHSQPDDKSLQKDNADQSCFSSNDRSRSPTQLEKRTLTPEDEYKQRQVQDVLRAIGMNLGFEELGQMSHRIQERLYGKKSSDGGHHRRGSKERDTRRAFSSRPRSGSSSSRSSFSPSAPEYYTKKDSHSSQRDVREVNQAQEHQTTEYGQNSSSVLQESESCHTNSQENTAECQTFSENPTYMLSEASPGMPVFSPVNCSPLPYQALPPALPPNLPHFAPGIFLPRLPPFLPYPSVPSLNVFPAVLAQTRHLLPPHISNPNPLVNLPIQPQNTTQKSKPLSRPRCLQVIETKQPG